MSDSCDAIRDLQSYLRALAFEYHSIPLIGIDGIFGANTTAAVNAFQALNAMAITGIVDYPTWTRIYNEYRKVSPYIVLS